MTTQPPNKPKRRTYSAEFKELLVQEAESSGRSIASIARDHSINQNLLHNWKRQHHRKKTQTGILPAAINSPADPNSCFSIQNGYAVSVKSFIKRLHPSKSLTRASPPLSCLLTFS